MRIARFALVGALLLGAAACQTEDGSAVAANIPPLAFVRYINAVPDTFPTTVRWVDQIDFTPMSFVNVPFRGLGQGGYQGLEAGSRHFRVFTYDPALAAPSVGVTTAQLADTTFDFVAGQYYTVLHLGYARTGQLPAQKVYILNDALPAASNQVSLRAINAIPGAAVDIFATAAKTTTLVGAVPAFTNVAFNTTTAYTSRAAGAFATQFAATGTTGSLYAETAPAGVAGSASADPIAGATVGGSVLTAIAFPAAVRPGQAAGVSVAEATGRTIDTVTAIAGGWQIADSLPTSWAAGRFAKTANSFWLFTITPTACPTVTAPVTAKCETRPAAKTDTLTGNAGGGLVSTASNLTNYQRSYYRDTIKTPVDTNRVVDTVYAIAGGYEMRDSTARPWVASAFVPKTDTTWIMTITPTPCPTVPAGSTIACATRPAAVTARLSGNGTNVLQTAVDLSAYQQAYFYDTVTTAGNLPPVQIRRSANFKFSLIRDVARRSARSTYSITATNPPTVIWFSDRQPPRTTTP